MRIDLLEILGFHAEFILFFSGDIHGVLFSSDERFD